MNDSEVMNVLSGALEQWPEKIVLSSLRDADCPYHKAVIRKIVWKGNTGYQIERFTGRQAFHENIEKDALPQAVYDLFPSVYGQINLFGEQKQWDFRITKKGKLLKHVQNRILPDTERPAGRGRLPDAARASAYSFSYDGAAPEGPNRVKRYLLKEGTVVPPLVDLGIFTAEGKVVQSKYDKYKQINRFLELVEDVLKELPDRTLHIIDFGCGKSYLTFILYYYLVECRNMPVHMTGLDLKEDVIRKCNETARKYHYGNLQFELGDINGYRPVEPVDMVITLHACDTATDYALYNAVSWDAPVILSVPCCQHEVNAQIHSEEFSLLTRYGIVKERVSALMTDAIRGNVLEYCGYKTQLLEFIDLSHSPKNIMLRAVKGSRPKEKREEAWREVERLQEAFGFRQTLAELIRKERTDDGRFMDGQQDDTQ